MNNFYDLWNSKRLEVTWVCPGLDTLLPVYIRRRHISLEKGRFSEGFVSLSCLYVFKLFATVEIAQSDP